MGITMIAATFQIKEGLGYVGVTWPILDEIQQMSCQNMQKGIRLPIVSSHL